MTDYNPENERVKKQYFIFLAEADQKATATIDGVRKAILRFETYSGFKDFKTFNKEQAIAFKNHLAKTKAERTGEPLSKATVYATLNALKDFFKWLAYKPGYKASIEIHNIEYFNLTEKEVRVAKTAKYKTPPTLEQIRHVVQSMPVETDVQRRNRALVAFTALTGMRDGALASLRLKHVDTLNAPPLVRQEPDMVKTKFSKQIETYFFSIGDDFKMIALDWIKELREIKLYGENAPVFPRTKIGHDGNDTFAAQGLEPECWSTASPIRQIFRDAFAAAGLPYFNPHSFRHMLVCLGQRLCKSAEDFKAWSQNLGHENVLTTLNSYGHVPAHRQGEVIKELSQQPKQDLLQEIHSMLKSRH